MKKIQLVSHSYPSTSTSKSTTIYIFKATPHDDKKSLNTHSNTSSTKGLEPSSSSLLKKVETQNQLAVDRINNNYKIVFLLLIIECLVLLLFILKLWSKK